MVMLQSATNAPKPPLVGSTAQTSKPITPQQLSSALASIAIQNPAWGRTDATPGWGKPNQLNGWGRPEGIPGWGKPNQLNGWGRPEGIPGWGKPNPQEVSASA